VAWCKRNFCKEIVDHERKGEGGEREGGRKALKAQPLEGKMIHCQTIWDEQP
jgi:hypothetical protein